MQTLQQPAIAAGVDAADREETTNVELAQPATSVGRFDRWAGQFTAVLASMVLHVIVLLILACTIFQAGMPNRGLTMTAYQGDDVQASLDIAGPLQLDSASALEAPTALPSPVPELALDYALQQATETPQSPNNLVATLTAGSLTEMSASSLADVADSLSSGGRKRGASFFGTYAQGERFVYILDSSRSMIGDRWTYACNRLIDSLRALNPDQEFFVICFDIQTSFMLNSSPEEAHFYPAEASVIDKVRRWLRGRTLGPATMPAEALQAALQFKPDAIFLLSDGELQDNSLGMLRGVNGIASEPQQIPIHTIHLFSLDGWAMLELMAMENGGTFTHIDGR